MNRYDQLNKAISQIRDHTQVPQPLEKEMMDANPFLQFSNWLEQAIDSDHPQPNTLCLATSNQDGKPSARMVLLKEFDESGFVFFTNSESQKGQDLQQNPQASMVFYWENLRRQVRITGKIERVSQSESDQYYQTRPRESQLGAWASPQSQVIEDRHFLEQELQQLREKYSDETQPIPIPPHWGGYRLIPTNFEFWQHHRYRLHDRFSYQNKDGIWNINRLAP